MATSGSKSVTVTNWDTLKFSWWENSQSVANNTTTIGWKMELIATSDGRISATATCPWEITVNGEEYSGNVNVGISNNTTKTLASGATTIKHNSDGSKTFSYSFSQYFGITFSGKWIATVSGSGSGTLDPIYRTSQPSCITWPEHTQFVGEFGDTISIHMNRQSSELTHTVRYQFGSKSGTIATNVGTGTTWTIPLELMDLIPNATIGSGTIYVDVYAEGTKIGTASCGFTAEVPASVKPSCSFVLEDVTGIDDIYGSPVRGLSKIKVTVTGKTAYSSPISSCSVEINGVKYSGMEITSGALNTSGSSVVKATVTDSRGRTGSVSYTMNVQDYSSPSVNKMVVIRCNKDGTENDQGEYTKVTFSASVYAMNNLNTATYALRYKKSDATTWTEVAFSKLDNVYTATDKTHIFAADSNSSYDVELIVTDKHNTTIRSTSVSTAYTLINWHPSGTGIRFGGVAEKEDTMQVSLDAEFDQATIRKGNNYAFSSPGTAGSAGYVLMAQIEITAAHADSPITFIFTQRMALHPMTVYIRFQSLNGLTPAVQSVTYEGSNYGAFLVQSSDSVWDLYVQKVSAYDTVTLQEWWASKTMSDRIRVTFSGTLVSTLPNPYWRATPAKMESLLDYIYPVGAVYIAYKNDSPATLFGGTWVRISNAFLWAVPDGGTIGAETSIPITYMADDSMPAINVAMWRRTA